MGVNGVGLAALSAGGVFIYGGLTNRSPLAAFQALVRGQAPASAPTGAPVTGAPATGGGGAGASPNGSGGGTYDGTPTASGTAQQYALSLFPSYGWNPNTEWQSLVNLWNQESGWSNTADTRKTGAGGDSPGSTVFAYGIAQARPATKYPLAGRPPDLGGSSDYKTQIRWGLNYIRGRYGDPNTAWAHEQSNNWY